MPIYEYVHDELAADTASPVCDGGRFEVLQSLNEPRLTVCPGCGRPCHRVISTSGIVTGKRHLLDPARIAKQGLTQYKRNGAGHYEKTTGAGAANLQANPTSGPGAAKPAPPAAKPLPRRDGSWPASLR